MVAHNFPGRNNPIFVGIQEVDQQGHELGVGGGLLGQHVRRDVISEKKESKKEDNALIMIKYSQASPFWCYLSRRSMT